MHPTLPELYRMRVQLMSAGNDYQTTDSWLYHDQAPMCGHLQTRSDQLTCLHLSWLCHEVGSTVHGWNCVDGF